jgi:catechol 2,3-dioxygenase-like lactoylglutathione lyase family enzyme
VIDHLGFVVADLEVARRFYNAVLQPLGIGLMEDNGGWLVYAGSTLPFLVVAEGRPTFWRAQHRPAVSPIHVGLTAPSRAAVDAFYHAGLVHGGSDNGAPGPRNSFSPYYAAYLFDPDGNNVEAGFRG